MRHFPVFLDLHGRTVLVLGTGEVGLRKAASLTDAGALVRLRDCFDPADLDECVLAIGADAAQADLEALSRTAQARGIPVNVVDRPLLCSFISPAVIDRSPVTIAVSTAGTAPVLARMLRQKIEALVPPAFGRLAAMAGGLSAEVRNRLPDIGQRRRVLERILGGAVADLMLAGREKAAVRAARYEIDRSEAAPGAGIVHLVGAGPGAGDLLTVRAQRVLGEADVIVHDRLVSDEVLDMARRDADRIYVGKARANHCMRQEDINSLLVRLAARGLRVVRLKGGDPFMFGRGGEEAAALRAAGIEFEVVPGVTAALACAADAGIPLTHRGLARTVTFATGHTSDGILDLNFPALVASGGTLVFYMGLQTLPEIRDGLRAAGMSGDAQAALVESGGTARSRTLRQPLGRLGEGVSAWHRGGPILLVVGAVVGATAPNEIISFASGAAEQNHLLPA